MNTAVASEIRKKSISNITSIASSAQTVIFMHVFIWIMLWVMVPWKIFPSVGEVLSAFDDLYNQGFVADLWTSFWLNVQALVISSIISTSIVYLSVMPKIGKHMKPYLAVVSKFRFMGLVGWSFAFTLMFGGGHYLKVSLMVFAMTGFMVTSMFSIVSNIPKETYDHKRTLRMGPWRVAYEAVIRGTKADMFEAIRQNAAIGWTMLTMVEGISRSEGGVGVLLLNQDKFLGLGSILAIQISILFLALGQDLFLGLCSRFYFPYAHLGKERR